MAAILVMLIFAPTPTSVAGYALLMGVMTKIALWLLLPSMALTVIAGLLAIAVNPVFHEAGWAWAKAATGILIFEGGLHVVGPLQEEAKRSAGGLAGHLDLMTIAGLFESERNTLWVLLAVTAANVALGVWRPRLPRLPD
jgi:hypothetical protein